MTHTVYTVRLTDLHIPPAEAEAAYYRQQAGQAKAA